MHPCIINIFQTSHNIQVSPLMLFSDTFFNRATNFQELFLKILEIFSYIPIFVIQKEEDNVLFNDALNTFYLRLYGVRHMVKDHSDSEKGNPQPPHRLLFPINSKGSFICTIPQTG